MRKYRRLRVAEDNPPPPDPLKVRLAPLNKGLTVKLAMETKSRHGRQNVTKTVLVLIAPANVYGMLPGTVVVTLVGKGSCVVIPGSGKGVGGLVKAGMPTELAKALVTTLEELHGEQEHGTTYPG